jgi:WD40 repeat protein
LFQGRSLIGLEVCLALLLSWPWPGKSPVAMGQPIPDKKPAARTDLYGDPLPPGALARLGTTRFRSGFIVYAVAFSPDGKTLAATAAGRPPCLFDRKTGKVLRQFGKKSHALALAFSPDGKFLAVGHNPIRLYATSTGKEVAHLGRNPTGGLETCLAFSPDGKTLASGGYEEVIRLWDVAKGKELGLCQGHQKYVRSLAFSPDGKTLASGSQDKTVRLWDPTTGKERRRLEGHQDSVRSVVFSPDGKTLASGSEDKTVRLWEVTSGKQIRLLKGHTGGVNSVAFAASGKTVASAGTKTIRLWQTATGKELHQISDGAWRAVLAVTFAPDGKTLASGGSWDSTVHLWDVATGKPRRRFGGHTGLVCSLAFSSDGKSLISASRDHSIRLWEIARGQERQCVTGQQELGLASVAFSPDRKTIATGGWLDNTVRLTEWATGKELRLFGKHRDRVWTVAFSPNGKTLASGGEDAVIRLWDIADGKELHQLKGHQGSIGRLAFSPDGKILASGAMSSRGRAGRHNIRFWQVATGKELRRLETHEDIFHIDFSPDGQILASSDHYFIRLWDVAAGNELRRFPVADQSSRYGVTFSPDGRSLAVCGGENSPLGLWEAATAQPIRTFVGHSCSITSLRFSSDGRMLATGIADSSILLWDLTGRMKQGRLQKVHLRPQDLEARWTDLAAGEASRADRAVWELVAGADQSIPFLQKHIQPAKPVDPRRIAPLLADLDSKQFATRRRATRALEQWGECIEPILRAKLAGNPSVEVRRRIENVLRKMQVMTGERLRAVRVLTVLERVDSPSARAVMASLAQGAPQVWLTREAQTTLQRMDGRAGAKP